MREIPVPCYGCAEAVQVDRRWPEQGLRIAGWSLVAGETYCPACARARGEGAGEPAAPPTGIAIADPPTRAAVTQYLRAGLTTALVGLVALAAVILIGGVHSLSGETQALAVGGTFSAFLLAGGVGAARRARRWQIQLAGSEWRGYRLTYVPVSKRSPGLLLAPADESHPPLMLRLGLVFRWRSLLLKTATGRDVWLAGDPQADAVLALHPGPLLFPARPIRLRNLGRYQAAADAVQAGAALPPLERYVAVEKAYKKTELRSVLGWGVMGLATISSPTLLAWLVVAAETLIWGSAVVRLRMARDRELGALDREIEAAPALTPGPPLPRGAGVPGAR